VISGLHAHADALKQLVSLGLIADATPGSAATATEQPAPPCRDGQSLQRAVYAEERRRARTPGPAWLLHATEDRALRDAEELLALLTDLATALAKARNAELGREFEQHLGAFAQA